MTIILRDDQQRLKSAVYNGWNAGARNMLAVLPTGGGKSIVVSDITLDGDRAGLRQVVMAHRKELVGQMSLHVARRGIKHRIIAPKDVIGQIVAEHRQEFNGKSFVNPDANCSVAGVDTLIARQETLQKWAAQIDRWTIDECFPAGTLIRTDRGDLPIETVREGHKVLAFDERARVFTYRKVLKKFKNSAPVAMFDILTNGHHIRCTAGHPFWTRRGWVEAKDLRTDDDLLVHMLGMRNSVFFGKRASKLSLQKNRKRVLHEKMWNEISRREKKTAKQIRKRNLGQNLSGLSFGAQPFERKDMFASMSVCNRVSNNEYDKSEVCVRKNERKKSNEADRKSCKNARNIEKNRSQACRARRKWKVNSNTGISIENNAGKSRFYSSVRDQNWSEKRHGNSDKLSSGYGASSFENRNRSGRRLALINSAQAKRSDERCDFNWSRVENIKIYKRSNNEGSTKRFVYNIEVDEFHTYIANGVVVHNCHHVTQENKWGKAVAMFPRAYGLGVTATPKRADGKGLGIHADGVFNDMVCGPTMRELIQLGALTDYEIVVPESDFEIDEDRIAPSGDFSPQTMREASKRSHIVGDVVTEYIKYAYGKRGITFATDVETAIEIANRFNESGIPAAAVSAETPSNVRNEYIRRFRNGQLWQLVNVDLFGEGFDVPACEVVTMARPTASLAVYLQQFGRALRTMAGKTHGLIIDHVSNWKRHGFPDKPHYWTLDRREKRAKRERDPEDIELTVCRNCSRPYEKCMTRCPHCGMEPPIPEPGKRTIEQIDGDLMLLDRAKLEEMRRAIELPSPADVGQRVAFTAGPLAGAGAINRQIERIGSQQRLEAAIAQWAGVQRALGRDDRVSYKRFFLTTGVDVLSALMLPRADMDKIAEQVEGWINHA